MIGAISKTELKEKLECVSILFFQDWFLTILA